MNFPKNEQNKKNNFNQMNDTPSPFDYYSQNINAPNQQNDISQQQMWKDQNLAMGGMGLGMYNPSMGGIGGMVGMGMNPMNPLMGMNMVGSSNTNPSAISTRTGFQMRSTQSL